MGLKSPTKLFRRLVRALKPKHNGSAPVPQTMPTPALQKRMAQLPELPLDIYELIIDFVWPDREALLACALTCRAWYARSRFNPFYRVELYNLNQLSQYSAQLAADKRIGHALRELYVTPYHAQSQLLGEFPFALAGQLPAVSRLRIDIRWDGFSCACPGFYTALSHFTSVTTLELWRVQFSALGDFAALVYALPSLHSLACWGVNWPWVENTSDAGALRDRKQCLRLKSLVLCGMNLSKPLTDWLLMAVRVQELQSISLLGVDSDATDYIENILEACGASLRSLDIHLEFLQWVARGPIAKGHPLTMLRTETTPWWEYEAGQYPRLVHNTSLTTLGLHLDARRDWAPALLFHSCFPAIQEIVLHLPRLCKPTEVECTPLDALDSVLAEPQFSGLRRLIVECDSGADTLKHMDRYKAEVSSRLPLSCGRGLVSICPRKSPEPISPPRPVVTKSKSETKHKLRPQWYPF